jgi:hypothetical protein
MDLLLNEASGPSGLRACGEILPGNDDRAGRGPIAELDTKKTTFDRRTKALTMQIRNTKGETLFNLELPAER